MPDGDEWCGCGDLATERAGALCEIALNFDMVKDQRVRKTLLRTMDLLNDGIEANIRPSRTKDKNVVPFRKPDAS